MAAPTPTPSHSSSLLCSSSKWEPGVRVRRKLTSSGSGSSADIVPSLLPRSRSNSHGKGPKSGETSAGSSAVQDSGFCTESKEHSAASSSGGGATGGGGGASGRGKNKEVEDELMNLLDMIQAKGTALRLEVDYLQSQLCSGPEGLDLVPEPAANPRPRRKCRSLELFPSMLSDSSNVGPNTSPCGRPRDELFGLKKERDHLARRVKTLELDSAQNLALTNSLLAEVGALSAEKRYLADRLANYHSSSQQTPCFTPVKHYEVDDEGREMSSTNPYQETQGRGGSLFPPCTPPTARPSDPVPRKLAGTLSTLSTPPRLGTLDGIVSSPAAHMSSPRGVKLSRYKEKMAAILREKSPLELQRHLLTTVFHNEILNYQVDNVTKSRVELVCQLAKIKEENEDLKFQLEEKNIELEGTRARVRLYERLQTVKLTSGAGGDGVHTLVPANPILPQLTLPCSEPQPLSSSTESAHHEDSSMDKLSGMRSTGSSMDKLSVTRSPSKRRSKIPLKAYAAPKTPTDLSNHSNGVPGNKLSSSIPKYQKDISWHSNQSRKSAESLVTSRNWDAKTSSQHVTKKPAILSNKELSLASSRRESLPLKSQQPYHHAALGKSHNGEAFARRLRKTSSESSTNSSASSVSPVMKKSARPVTGQDSKLKPPSPLRKLNRPHRSRSLEKSSIITLPAVDEVNECPDSLDVNPESSAGTTQHQVVNHLSQESDSRLSRDNVANNLSQESDVRSTKDNALNTTSQESNPRLHQHYTREIVSQSLTQQVNARPSKEPNVKRDKDLDARPTQDTVSSLRTQNTTVQSSQHSATARILKSSKPQDLNPREPQDSILKGSCPRELQDDIPSQALVKDLTNNNNETYVVKSSHARQGIPEFSPTQDKADNKSQDNDEHSSSKSEAEVISSKSHTYRVRRNPNRLLDSRDDCESERCINSETQHRDQNESLGGTPSTQDANEKPNHHHRVKRSKRMHSSQNGQVLVALCPNQTVDLNLKIDPNLKGQKLSSNQKPTVHHSINSGATPTKPVVHVIQNGQAAAKSIVHLIQSSRHVAMTPLTSVPTEVTRSSMEYFDSIETVTSGASVLHSAAGSSMNSNRPRRESLAECDSLDQSQPDISDSEDLV